MRFVVQEARVRPTVTEFPTVVLSRDNWDDYHFRTMFVAWLHLRKGKTIDLEHVKILKRGQESGKTDMPGRPFSALPAEYCSLGQAFSY